MPTKLDNLIIFGDSMSDIGSKREQPLGMVARAMGWMRTNEVGRYSDGRIWTDFLWQWAGGRDLVHKDASTSRSDSAIHRQLSQDSLKNPSLGRPITYCNYAEGGAMGASDRPSTGLGIFKDQVARYIEERQKTSLSGNTLHIIWFGLNDLVTNPRPPETMNQVADEMGLMMRTINMEFGEEAEHFMIINLPSPAGAARFIAQNDLSKVVVLDKGAKIFNHHLLGLKDGHYYHRPDKVTVIDIYEWFNKINDNLGACGLKDGSQPKGILVNYQPHNSVSSDGNWITTSDGAHPTEAVHKLMTKEIVKEILAKYELGKLGQLPLT